MNNLLPKILSKITGKERQKSDIVWSDNSFTHNIFRAYEMIFGVKVGVVRQTVKKVQYDSNRLPITVSLKYLTLESRLCHYEGYIREMFKKLSSIRLEVVELSPLMTTSGIKIPLGYKFAIAFDNSITAFNATFTTSFTVTGSSPAIFMGTIGDVAADNQTGSTYNSVSMGKPQSSAGTGRAGAEWFLAGTGDGSAHNLVTTGGAYCEQYIISFSGCKNVGTTPDSSAKTGVVAGTTLTMTTTVVAANSWLAGYAKSGGGSTYTAGTGTVMQYAATNEGSCDSNAAVAAGSRSLVITKGSEDTEGYILSIEPFVASGPSGVKTWNGITQSTGVKTYGELALGSTKTWDGIS